MIQKIKLLWSKLKTIGVAPEGYTREQLENAYRLGYTDGKRDGLTIAREQATKSLKEILKWQNNHPTKK